MILYHQIQAYQVVNQALLIIQVNQVKKCRNLDHALEKIKINEFFNTNKSIKYKNILSISLILLKYVLNK